MWIFGPTLLGTWRVDLSLDMLAGIGSVHENVAWYSPADLTESNRFPHPELFEEAQGLLTPE